MRAWMRPATPSGMQAFKQRAQQQFGSGWVWLALDRSDYDVGPKDLEALVIIALPNQVPQHLMQGVDLMQPLRLLREPCVTGMPPSPFWVACQWQHPDCVTSHAVTSKCATLRGCKLFKQPAGNSPLQK